MAKGEKWVAKAFSQNKGALHRDLHVAMGKKIPMKTMEAAMRSSKTSSTTKRRINLAETARGFRRA